LRLRIYAEAESNASLLAIAGAQQYTPPALQAPLAALAISTPSHFRPRESAGFSCENGSLSPAAGWGTGTIDLSRRTCSLSRPGKCRVFLRKRFTFPCGSQGHWLHRPLSLYLPFPPSGKVPGFSTKTVHFPPRPTGAPAPQTSLAVLAISTLGESAGFFCENGSLPPAAGWGIGSTGLSRGICRFYLRGKCRTLLRKRFTFPRGSQGHRLHRPLSRHLPFPPPGKVPGISAKTVHFPPWPAGAPALQTSLAALAISTSRESAGLSCENGSLSPAAGWSTGSTGLSRCTCHFHPRGKCRTFRRKRFTFPRDLPWHRLYRPLSPHLPFPPPGKVPGFPAKTVHFPPWPAGAPAP